MSLPTALTPAAVGVAIYFALDEPLWGALAAASVVAAYALWVARGRRWHDLVVVAALMPALAASVTARSLALTGLVATLAGYQGRHHPREARDRASRSATAG